MTLLFLPIDIQVPTITYTDTFERVSFDDYNPFWNSTAVNDTSIPGLDALVNQLPFDKITILTHKIQQRPVSGHFDVYPTMDFAPGEYEHICANEPAGYRILLKGQLDKLEVFNGKEWITAKVPSSPGCYILNSTTAKHRVKADPGREILYVRGFLNIDKHKELLDRSYKKYKDCAIELL